MRSLRINPPAFPLFGMNQKELRHHREGKVNVSGDGCQVVSRGNGGDGIYRDDTGRRWKDMTVNYGDPGPDALQPELAIDRIRIQGLP